MIPLITLDGKGYHGIHYVSLLETSQIIINVTTDKGIDVINLSVEKNNVQCGYVVRWTEDNKSHNAWFTSKDKTMDENLKLANDWLDNLKKKYANQIVKKPQVEEELPTKLPKKYIFQEKCKR